MTNTNDPHASHEDLEGFDTVDSEFDGDDAVAAHADDTDYSDGQDDLDAEVFGEEPPAEEAPKKKGVNWFNIGVVVVALVLAGGLIWFKISAQTAPAAGQSAQATPADAQAGPEAAANNAADAAQQALQPQQDAGAAAPTPAAASVLDNPDQLASFNPSQPAPVQAPTPQDPFAALGSNNGGNAPAAAPAPQSAAPATAVPMPAPISGAATAQPAPAATAPVAAETASAAPAPATASPDLTARVDALEQKLNDMDGKLTTALDKIGTGSAAAPVDDARLSAIQSSLDKLSARLDGMSVGSSKTADIVSAAPLASTDESAPAVQKTSVRKAAKTPVRRKATTAKAASEWDQPYKSSSDAEKQMRVSSSGKGSAGWELRGAQDGRAVLAKDGDLREVGVGDSVSGLGQITGIASVNGHWVVQGTAGRVTQ